MRGQIQRAGHGALGRQSRGLVQLVQPPLHAQDRVHAGATANRKNRVRPLQTAHLPRHQAREFSDRTTILQQTQLGAYHRLRPGQGLHRPEHGQTHTLHGTQEFDRHGEIHEY